MGERLAGKVAVVTGAASGIGLATVERFVAEGARVLAADIQDEKGEALQARHGGAVLYRRCDVTREADIAAALDAAEAAFGGLDVMVNNAGAGGAPKGVADLTAEDWEASLRLVVQAPALGIKHAAPRLARRGGGAIVNTASAAGLHAGFAPLAYSVGKAAVLHLTKCAAAELSPQRVRVNAVAPGLIATAIFGTTLGMDRPAADALAARVGAVSGGFQPYPRAGEPRDIANAIVFLASDEAEFVTGATLLVDGGISVGPPEAWERDAPPKLLSALGLDAPRPVG